MATSCPLVRVMDPDGGWTSPKVTRVEVLSRCVDTQLTVTSPYVPSRLTPTCTKLSAAHTHIHTDTGLLFKPPSFLQLLQGGQISEKRTSPDSWSRSFTSQMSFLSPNHVKWNSNHPLPTGMVLWTKPITLFQLQLSVLFIMLISTACVNMGAA